MSLAEYFNSYPFIDNLISLIDKGSKLIPCVHLNENDIFKFILASFEDNYNHFNSLIHLHKNKKSQDDSNLSEELNLELDNCSFIDCFSNKLKRLKNNFSKLKFDINKESIDFKFNFYKSLPYCPINEVMNASLLELRCLKDFIKKKQKIRNMVSF